MARNFYCVTFFGHIFNRNNLTFIKARILRKEYFNRSRFCFLDFTITSTIPDVKNFTNQHVTPREHTLPNVTHVTVTLP